MKQRDRRISTNIFLNIAVAELWIAYRPIPSGTQSRSTFDSELQSAQTRVALPQFQDSSNEKINGQL